MGRRPDRYKIFEPLPCEFMARILDAFGCSQPRQMSLADAGAFGIVAMIGALIRLAQRNRRGAVEAWEAIWSARCRFPDLVASKGLEAAMQQGIREIASFKTSGRALRFELQLLLEDCLLAEELEAMGGDRRQIRAWLQNNGFSPEEADARAGDPRAMLIRGVLSKRHHSTSPSTQEKLLARAGRRVRGLRRHSGRARPS